MKAFIFITTLVLSLYSSSSHQYTNALIDEESPYLLQHAHNPVNWFAWNKDAFKLAKGYSTCHWCHVMEEESFENKKIAALLNQSYISIKVDKEEIPHLDTAFQEIHSKLKQRRNGWPLNFILTPEKKLIYITTYIPPTFKYEVEGMDTLIPRIAKQYQKKDPKLLAKIKAYERILEQKEQEALKEKTTTNLSQHFVLI